MHVFRVELGAARQCWYGLAGIEQLLRIEALANGMELIALWLCELDAHFTEFFDADAVFTGDGSATLDAQLQNPATQLLGSFEFALVAGIVKNQRVQVAVTGVKHVGHGQTVLLRELPYPGQYRGQRLARDSAVYAVVIG